jgi:peptide deformylase
MSILKILQYPDLRLRTKARPVLDVKSPKIQKIIKNMLKTLANQENCSGLASTQLDIKDPPGITVINNPYNDEVICLVNPQIIGSYGSTFSDEGCMSIAPESIHAKVKRATRIMVSALDLHGNQMTFEAKDYLACIIQHECDHLEGILYIDHLSESERKKIDKEIAKLPPKS